MDQPLAATQRLRCIIIDHASELTHLLGALTLLNGADEGPDGLARRPMSQLGARVKRRTHPGGVAILAGFAFAASTGWPPFYIRSPILFKT
jgi:hypothetical protein